jgi:KaiC/GvpD/RAD55 family RecA-like ATPase
VNTHETDYVSLIGPVAKFFWGDPSTVKPNEWRWGSHGSRRADLTKGTWHDFETETGGGVLQLVERETGCRGKAAADHLRKIGLLDADDRPTEEPIKSKPAMNKSSFDKSSIKAIYPYTDESGEVSFEVVRYDPKDFRQRRLVDGSYLWTIRSCRAVKEGKRWRVLKDNEHHHDERSFPDCKLFLYRLPELMEAIANANVVFVVEGEKDVETLRKMNIPATTAPMGANKWNAEYTNCFKGADVVLIPDLDKSGENHMVRIGELLQPICQRVRIFRIPIPNPSKDRKDITDWFDKCNGTVEQFFDLVDAESTQIDPAPFKSQFSAVFFKDLDAPGPEHHWLMKYVWTLGEISMVVGASGSGKSFLATDMAMCVAQGIPYRDFKCRQGLVVYVAGEGGMGMKRRLRAYREANGISPDADIPFVLLPRPIDIYSSDDDMNKLIEEIQQIKARFSAELVLIVLDTLSASVPGADENASRDMGMVLSRVKRISQVFSTHVSIVHHLTKEGSSPRGWSGLFANLDSVLEVRKTDNLDVDGRPIRTAKLTKQKDGEDGIVIPFVLKNMTIGIDEDGDPITTCVVMPNNGGEIDCSGKVQKPQRFSRNVVMGWDALAMAIGDKGIMPPGSLGLPKSVTRVVTKAIFLDYIMAKRFERKGTPGARDTARKHANDFIETLNPRGAVGMLGDYLWPVWTSLNGEKPPPEPPHAGPISSEDLENML